MAKKSNNWIKGAISHPGAVKRAAKKHGKSVKAEAKAESKSSNKKIASRGRLALRLTGSAKHGNLRKARVKKHAPKRGVSKGVIRG